MKLKSILIVFAILVSALAVQPASAGNINQYYIFTWNDLTKEFFFSDIYERDFIKYKDTNDKNAFVKYVYGGTPSVYSVGTYRAKTRAEAESSMANYEKIFKGKGYSISHKSWTP